MEILLVIPALLVQIICLFSFVFTFLLFLKFDKIKNWFNKKAGETIISSFSLRALRTPVISGFIGILLVIGNVLFYGIFIEDESHLAETQLTETQIYWMFGISFILGMIYPTWRFIKRVKLYRTAENKKAELWRFIYDVLIIVSICFGGAVTFVLLAFLSVILSFTKWNDFVPRHLHEMSGVDVVPKSNNYYFIGVALGIFAAVTQFIAGQNSEDIVGGIIVITLMIFCAFVWYKIRKATPEEKKRITWQWSYMAITVYAVFILTAIAIIIMLTLLVLYLVLSFIGNSGGKGKYHVTCDNLTDDIINGRGICRFTNTRCKMRDTGICPFK